MFSSQDSSDTNHGSASSICDNLDTLSETEEDTDLNSDECEVGEFETQEKILSFQEYKKLMQLIPEVNKLRNTNNKMAEIIKLRDSQLNDLREVHRLARNIDLSHLNTVSVSL